MYTVLHRVRACVEEGALTCTASLSVIVYQSRYNWSGGEYIFTASRE